MNAPLAATAAGALPQATLRAGTTPARAFLTLVRREFWEHRSLWMAPTVAAALIALSALFGQVHLEASDIDAMRAQQPELVRVAFFTIGQWLLAMPIYLVMATVVTFYLLDCLYAERKDRSILFWKSLPVSDAQTVLAKLVTGLVVVPLGSWLLALVSFLVFFGIWSVRVSLGYAPDLAHWGTLAWVRMEWATLLAVLLAILWYAPLAALLQLVSVLVRRAPMMWLTLALIGGVIAERILLGTHYLWGLIVYRSDGIWGLLAGGPAGMHIDKHNLIPLDAWLLKLNFAGAFAAPALWLGVLAAAGLVALTVRIRRYRDDT
ncbi:MAG: hypothetical protein JO341_05405 [Gammaproteobacteria bacterium]|nr:hypothetical protein [Gammaproteobacteria bacterium]MBV9620443.1 hypothetical protein [Gammaproteobacteria bacterium]